MNSISAASAQLGSEPDVFSTTLPNGLRVIVRERPSSHLAAISVGIRGGSRVENDVTLGAAHFMEHMFFQGTPRRPELGDLDRDLEFLGGYSNAWTGQESINFQIVVPDHAFNIGLDIMSDMMVNSDFPADRFEKERKVVLEELNRGRDNPQQYVGEIFGAEIARGHPTEKLPIGSRATINNITRDVILQYRDTYFVASNMVVAVAGNVNHDAAFEAIAAGFAGMRQGPRPEIPVVPPPTVTPRRIGVPYSAQQVQINYGFAVAGSDSDDRYPLEVANAVLGGVGQRLFTDIVDNEGLALSISSGYPEYTDMGVFEVSASVPPSTVQAVVDRIGVHLEKLATEPLSDEELQDAKLSIAGSLELRQESVSGLAQELSDGVALGYYMPIDQYVGHIQAVTAADVQRIASRYLDPARALIVTLPGTP
ncbi:MAG TPA: pitrilysin family protein [Chloroflexota bacterium]|nr:pitrilysin family protein [Chloroflexota bacterium]